MKHGFADIDEVTKAVLESPGASPNELRKAVETKAAFFSGLAEDTEIPDDLHVWVEKVAKHAYKTTDSDVQELKNAGYTEDQIFELTVAAAHGAARARMELALLASEIGGGSDEA